MSRVRAAGAAAIEEAAQLIRAGRLVAFPTETVYGLGADAGNDAAVASIFAAKRRPRFNPLIVHVAEPTTARRLADFPPLADKLAERFWPGPLTLVLRRRPEASVSLLACAGLDTVALRLPAHPVALELIARAGRPIAAPSANPSGQVSPTTAAHVVDGLGERVAMVLDGGPCRVGLESTVLDLSGTAPVLLRPGGTPREAIESLTGPLAGPLAPTPEGGAQPRSPGQLESHYAPRLRLRLMAQAPERPNEALLAFGPHPPAGYARVINLSPTGNLIEAAANLFAALRALDRPDYAAIAAMPIPESGLGQAINDRLRRAAAPRSA